LCMRMRLFVCNTNIIKLKTRLTIVFIDVSMAYKIHLLRMYVRTCGRHPHPLGPDALNIVRSEDDTCVYHVFIVINKVVDSFGRVSFVKCTMVPVDKRANDSVRPCSNIARL
jgi:hypothetical protein